MKGDGSQNEIDLSRYRLIVLILMEPFTVRDPFGAV